MWNYSENQLLHASKHNPFWAIFNVMRLQTKGPECVLITTELILQVHADECTWTFPFIIITVYIQKNPAENYIDMSLTFKTHLFDQRGKYTLWNLGFHSYLFKGHLNIKNP